MVPIHVKRRAGHEVSFMLWSRVLGKIEGDVVRIAATTIHKALVDRLVVAIGLIPMVEHRVPIPASHHFEFHLVCTYFIM